MSGKEKHDLTAFEAALASVAPRVDAFDREQLLFLAGQASALRGRSRHARWGWPAAFSTMSAIAATLLVMLYTRPEASLSVRAIPAATSVDVEGSEPDVEPADVVPPPVVATWLADWFPAPASRRSRLYEQILAHDADRPQPDLTASAGPTVVAEESLPYHKLLERLLEDQPSAAARRPPWGID